VSRDAPSNIREATAAARTRGLSRLDADLLLAHCCGFDRARVIAHPEHVLDPAAESRWQALLHRRAEGEPMAYLLGVQGFLDFDLTVTPDVLIPRADTELLVEAALALPLPEVSRAIDLGTGSGAIAIALARARQSWRIVASDRSVAALRVAQTNIDRLAPNRVQLVCCDWFTGIAPLDLHLVIANPPYVAAGDPELAADVAAYEPRTALIADHEGLGDLERLAGAAAGRLRPGGWVLLEHGHRQGPAVRSLLARHNFEAVETRRDAAGHERVSLARRPDTAHN